MKVKILAHNVVLRVEHFDDRTKIVTVKMFGMMCKFKEHEYKIIKDKIK